MRCSVKRVVISLLALSVSSALMAATPKFDGARISADVKELASDAYEGRSPATVAQPYEAGADSCTISTPRAPCRAPSSHL